MFGAKLSLFATCCYGRNIRYAFSRSPRVRVEVVSTCVATRRYSTQLSERKQLKLELRRPELTRSGPNAGILNKRTPLLLPVIGVRLYTSHNEQRPTEQNKSVLTRLLEEEQSQPKALTVGERGA